MAKFEFIFDDDHYRDIADLLIGLRDARAAWHAAEAGVHEWEIFSLEIRGGQRASAPLATLIDLAQTWAVGWWRRAHAEARARAKLHAPLKTRRTLSEPSYEVRRYNDRNDRGDLDRQDRNRSAKNPSPRVGGTLPCTN